MQDEFELVITPPGGVALIVRVPKEGVRITLRSRAKRDGHGHVIKQRILEVKELTMRILGNASD